MGKVDAAPTSRRAVGDWVWRVERAVWIEAEAEDTTTTGRRGEVVGVGAGRGTALPSERFTGLPWR